MAIDTPKYEEGNIVYFRESAALGFLEAVAISGITRRQNQWIYAITAGRSNPIAPRYYGDRVSLVNAQQLFYTEDELITECDALDLAIANAERVLTNLQAQRTSICS